MKISNEQKMEKMKNHESAQIGFTKIYADGNPPWEIGKPQPPFVEIADQVMSPVLDCGCGTGNTSLFFADRGLKITGVDFVEEAILKARAKADERNLSVEFLIKDAITLCEWDKCFASIIDSGLFHIFDRDELRLKQYLKGLAHVLKPGGRLFLFSFSDKMESLGVGGMTKLELYETFADGWEIESLELVRGECNPIFVAEFPEWNPNNGEPKMWFAIIRRKE
jgi:SAM-dependent methyltransferase